MKNIQIKTVLAILSLVFISWSPASRALPTSAVWNTSPEFTASAWQAGKLLVADNHRDEDSQEEPESGTLVLPITDTREDKKAEKNCMTVCARWGNECTFINRGAGGLTKKCRRTCKQFAEECF